MTIYKEFYIKARNSSGHWFGYCTDHTWQPLADATAKELYTYDEVREEAVKMMVELKWIYGIEVLCINS